MSTVQSLRQHLIDELTDLLSAETQLTKALPKMADAAATRSLQQALQKHLKETEGHRSRLKQALKALGEEPREKTCEAMAGLLEEGEELMNGAPTGSLRDAMMITAAQKVEHYEIASYGTARTYAELLGEPSVAKLLAQTLGEEKAADAKLTQIAEQSVNSAAAKEQHQRQADEGLLTKSAEWVGEKLGVAANAAANAAAHLPKSMTNAAARLPKTMTNVASDAAAAAARLPGTVSRAAGSLGLTASPKKTARRTAAPSRPTAGRAVAAARTRSSAKRALKKR